MVTHSLLKKMMLSIVLVVFCAGSFTGCASLRKKFTRVPRNPKATDDFIPVLQPEEYKNVVETPRQVYGGHYSMVKIYFKDLWDVLERRDSTAKREKYIFTELLSHFDAMAVLLSEEKKSEAAALRARVQAVLKEYDKPDGLRRYDIIRNDMHQVEREIYKGFKPDAVAKALVASGS